MIPLTKQQIGQRWDTLPDALREALASEANSDFIWTTCEAQQIPDEKIYAIAADVAAVLMGFVQIDDAAEAFKNDAAIDPKVAMTIQESLKAKIFAPLKQAIEAAYKPVGEPEIKTSIVPPSPNGPKMFDVATPGAAMAKPAANGVPVPKQDLPGKGWSGMRPAAMPTAIPTPSAPSAMPKPATMASIPVPTPMKAAQQRPPAIPQPPKPIAEPAPVMLEQSTQFTAPQKNSNFRLPTNATGAQVELGGGKPQPVKTMPAFIEFSQKNSSGSPSTASPASFATSGAPSPTAPKGAVHYTEFGKTTSAMPIAPSGARKLDEITSSSAPNPITALKAVAPMPTAAPVPIPKPPQSSVPTPTPPTPQPQQPVKVITKDFL